MFQFTQQTVPDDPYQIFQLLQQQSDPNNNPSSDPCPNPRPQPSLVPNPDPIKNHDTGSTPNNNPSSNPCPNPSPQPSIDPSPDPNKNIESKHRYSGWLPVDSVECSLELCTQLAQVKAIESKFYGGIANFHPYCLTSIFIYPVTPFNGKLLSTFPFSCKDNTCKHKTENQLTSFCHHSLTSLCFLTPFDGEFLFF